jgi:prophage regulatory protein
MTTDRILRCRAVLEATGLKKTSLYANVKSGAFPKPIAIGQRAVGWRESEVQQWIRSRQSKGGAA